MKKEEFINAIKQVVIEDSINSMESILVKPPGRSPQKKAIMLSEWFNRLDNQNIEFIKQVIRESIETGIFGFLCVLDGVRAIENEEKGNLLLYYKKNDTEVLLNDPNEDYLHDLL
jgi:hypothetical protein